MIRLVRLAIKETPAVAVLAGVLCLLLLIGLIMRLLGRTGNHQCKWLARLAPPFGRFGDMWYMAAGLSIVVALTAVYLAALEERDAQERVWKSENDEALRLFRCADFQELRRGLLSESEVIRRSAAGSLRSMLLFVSKAYGISRSREWCREVHRKLGEWYAANAHLVRLHGQLGVYLWKDEVPEGERIAKTFAFPRPVEVPSASEEQK